MNKTIRTIAFLAVGLALLGFGQGVRAQEDIGGGGGSLGESGSRAGSAGAVELLVPLTARYTALGSSATSGMANMSGLEALYANPAGLALANGTGVIFSRMDYVADIGVNFFGISQSFGNNNLAFTVSTWDFGDIPRQTEIAPEVSSVTFNVSYITAGFSYARVLTDRISVGATVKMVSESIDDMSASATAFDAGMNYVVGESGLRIGVALKNIGSELQFSGVGLTRQVQLPGQDPSSNSNGVQIESEGMQLPTLLNFGAAYTRPVGAGSSVTVLGNFRSNSFDPDQYSGGLEFNFRDLFFLRGGYQAVQDQDDTFYTGASLGAGINLSLGGSNLAIDYAYVPTDYFDSVSYVTAVLTL